MSISINERKVLLRGLADLLQLVEEAEELAYRVMEMVGKQPPPEYVFIEAERLATRILGK